MENRLKLFLANKQFVSQFYSFGKKLHSAQKIQLFLTLAITCNLYTNKVVKPKSCFHTLKIKYSKMISTMIQMPFCEMLAKKSKKKNKKPTLNWKHYLPLNEYINKKILYIQITMNSLGNQIDIYMLLLWSYICL